MEVSAEASRPSATQPKQSADKRLQIHKYFQPFPKWALVVASVGLISFWAGSHWFGSLVAFFGALVIAAWRDRPSDQQIEEWIEEDLTDLRPAALAKCGLVAEEEIREPVVIQGPRLMELGGAQFGIRRGTDGIIRYTPIHVAVVHFTENFLSVYECGLDLLHGSRRNESAQENYYPDIVAVTTQSRSTNLSVEYLPKFLHKKLAKVSEAVSSISGRSVAIDQGEQFELTTSGGTSVQIFLGAPELARCLGGGEWPARETEEAVQVIRKMLREKKSA